MVLALNYPAISLDKQDLWKARESAMASVYRPWFPKVDQEHLNSIKTTFKGRALKVYSDLYNTASHIKLGIDKTTSAFASVIHKQLLHIPGYQRLEAGVYKVYNFVFPINAVNGQREFNVFPRQIEKLWGDLFVSPYYLSKEKASYEQLGSQGHYISTVNEEILQSLLGPVNNQEILNPYGLSQFNYRVFTAKSNHINAYAIPAGSMIVTNQMVQALHKEILKTKDLQSTTAIRSTTITLNDGKKVVIDLSHVELNDVIAPLIGHEMTHVASRHSTINMTLAYIGKLVFSCFVKIGLFFAKSRDKAYQDGLKNKHLDPLTHDKNEQKYLKKEESLMTLSGYGFQLLDLFRSRKNEHEADITGAFLAINAGYNPLGALYLYEFLAKSSFMPQWADFLSTHPHGEKRKLAVYTALQDLVPNLI